MMEHDPSRPPTSPSSDESPAAASRFRDRFSRARFEQFADKLGLTRLRNVPGIGWVIAVAAIALLIQGVGLANLISVSDEKQEWSATAGQRDALRNEIADLEKRKDAELRDLESKKLEAKTEVGTIKGMIDRETGRLAELQAALKLTIQHRDEAQREHGAASNEAERLREANEAIASKTKDLAGRLATSEAMVQKLEADQQRLAAEVATSRKTLEEHRAEMDRADKHAKDLDTKAAATLEAIRKSREAQVKAQSELDEANAQVAKAMTETEIAQSKIAAAIQQIKDHQSSIDSLLKQQAELKAAVATDKKLAEEAAAARATIDVELAALKEKLERASKSLAEKQGVVAAEESLASAAQVRQEAIKTRIANLQAEMKPLEEQRLAIEADIAGKRKELEALRERIEAARSDLKSMPPAALSPAPAAEPKPAPEKKESPQPPAEEKTNPGEDEEQK